MLGVIPYRLIILAIKLAWRFDSLLLVGPSCWPLVLSLFNKLKILPTKTFIDSIGSNSGLSVVKSTGLATISLTNSFVCSTK